MTGTQTIVDAIDRLYRLMDTSMNGKVYYLSADPVPVVEPAIPPVPSGFQPTEPMALRSQVARLHQLAENAATGANFVGDFAMDGTVNLDWEGSWKARLEAVQGLLNEGWFGIGGQPATLADMVKAMRVGSQEDTTRITAALDAIAEDSGLAQLSQGAVIFNTVKGLFEDVAEGIGEGAILGTLIAASIATSGMLGVVTAKLDQVLTALNANTEIAPLVDQVEPLLTDIKTLLS